MNGPASFDASSSALGYIYQIRYALLLALQRIDTVDDPDNCLVSIEKIDDISFHENDNPAELLQTKHHAKVGNLTDRSPDIWKTVRIWSEFIADSRVENDAAFTLVTTGAATNGSLAKLLSPDRSLRNTDSALQKMRDISQENHNSENRRCYEAFQALSMPQQRKLVGSIYIISSSPAIDEVARNLEKKLRTTVDNKHIKPFLMRLEGFWFRRAIEVLTSTNFDAIPLDELIVTIDDLRAQFLPGNLPSDFDDALPEIIDASSDNRTFVEQLRLISANDRVITNAIISYYRACEQRSRWSREGLLKPGEIKKYLTRLKDEWEHYRAIHEMNSNSNNDVDSQIAIGRGVLTSCLSDGAHPIRRDFNGAYVARGSYHDLADRREVGWHPDFADLLPAANEGAA